MSARNKKGSSHDPTFTGRKRGTWEIIRRVSVYLRPYKFLAAATIGCAIFSLLFSFVFPRMTAFVIDDVLQGGRPEWLMPSIAAIVAAFFLSEVFNSLRIRVNNHLEQHVIFDMRRQVYGKLQTLPTNYFDQRASGDLMTRVIEDVNNVERIIIDGTEQGTLVVLQVFGVFTIMAFMNLPLAMVALIPFPFLIVGAWWYSSTAHHRYRDQRRASSAINALLMDNLQGNREVKAYGREAHENNRFRDRAEDLRRGTLKIMHAWATYSPSMDFLMAIGYALVLFFGVRQFFAGDMTIQDDLGKLTAFILYLHLFYEPVRRFHQLNQILQAARASGERVFDILDTDPERPAKSTDVELPKRVSGHVEFQNVSFAYESDLPILKNVDLSVSPGEIIALVGPTGAGKSTIVNLLPAFYEASVGKIMIDGQDISQTSLQSLRRQIAIVNQEPFLFNGTLTENIRYGRLDATDEEMHAAAKAANCHAFIAKLPDGYESHVGERGVKLSVGEKQRVSIARAILKDAPILILDEATASVDTATERLIQEALEHLMKGRTSFVIAHRLSTIRNANQILVIRSGEIIERGTHDDLLTKDGLYSRLCKIQNTTFIEEGFAKLDSPKG